jgi:hypothetical protein
MPPLGPLLLALFAGLFVLLFHRDPRTLRNGHTILGAYVGLAGAAFSLTYACQVSFVILAAGSTDNCAAAFGLEGDRSSLRSLVSVTRQDFPPKVTCTYEGRNVTLTDPLTTHTWVHVWWMSVGLLTVSIALAIWGLMSTRGWRKRVIPER